MNAHEARIELGLHETLLDTDLEKVLEQEQEHLEYFIHAVDDAATPRVLANFVAQRLKHELEQIRTPQERVEFVNRLLAQFSANNAGGPVAPGPQQLRSVSRRPLKAAAAPTVPLSEVALLTNSHSDPRLGAEVRLELGSADRVDVIMSFVKVSGISVVKNELEALHRRGVPLRVLTTTYMGATERKAIDQLVRECHAEVRISYNNLATRLHAKAWIFHRNTGFHTGYVGSSNLSRAAMVDGLEWNVRISSVQTPNLLEKFNATFESYWNNPAFEPYDPDTDGKRLAAALAENRAGQSSGSLVAALDVHPYPYQEIILDDLKHARQQNDRHKNLVVAATGTGKTVVAALDYRRLCDEHGGKPRLLFVAHRQEILEQSLRTFRSVLGDGAFGELFTGRERPTQWDHVFASVQSLTRPQLLFTLERSHFDVVIIDEFHHGAAATYRRIVEHFTGYTEFLGLTATPERTDGQNIVAEFFDGHIASELRLWTALDHDLLVPFHYFGIADEVDVSKVQFTGGEYNTAALSELYTGNDARVRIILRNLERLVADPQAMTALGFCVSVEHAQYMAEMFTQAGIPSEAVTGTTPQAERKRAIERLAKGELNCLMAVDVFNEGFDLPSIDTVLMMRPTQSATVFMQQIGRGLRRSPGKAVLTVLDFVGHQHENFRFDHKLGALTGITRRDLATAVREKFPMLPSGSEIVLDAVVEKEVLEHLQQQLAMPIGELVTNVQEAYPDDTSLNEARLANFLDTAGIDLTHIYKPQAKRSYRGHTGPTAWTQVLSWAGWRPDLAFSEADSRMLSRTRALTHVDDPLRFAGYRQVLAGKVTDDLTRDPVALMLYYSLWPTGHPSGVRAGMTEMVNSDVLREEIDQLLEVKERKTRTNPEPLSGSLASRPIRSHATYSREELLAGLGVGSLNSEKPGSIREGVKWVPELETDILLITLHKSESEYSPTTMYHDYALTPTLFHWESQSLTSDTSRTGQRYIHHAEEGKHVVLFVRPAKTGPTGAAPYTCLGQATYVEHRGSRPMQITWKLERPMPPELFEYARAAQ